VSNETITDLNTNTLIGNTSQRGFAWHYRAEDQGEQSNHYDGPIPIEDVQRRLFSWTAESRPIAVELPSDFEEMTHLTAGGNPARWAYVEDRQAICRSDNDHVMGIFTTGYERHQYQEWLLHTVANILDDDLSISSAGLLRGGAVAWVEVSVPETITTPEGVAFRPNLLATTSFDGSTATTFKRTITDVVCDNTRAQALGEHGQQFKVKHSRYSQARLAPARDALALIHSLADDFATEVATLCATPVSDLEWSKFLDAHVPSLDDKGVPLVGRLLTMAQNKRNRLQGLYRNDSRVSPWKGTAHGVLQAVNTYEHHEGIVRATPFAPSVGTSPN
jgi:phage/plasmid-like protein (TIGR03299 family)